MNTKLKAALEAGKIYAEYDGVVYFPEETELEEIARQINGYMWGRGGWVPINNRMPLPSDELTIGGRIVRRAEVGCQNCPIQMDALLGNTSGCHQSQCQPIDVEPAFVADFVKAPIRWFCPTAAIKVEPESLDLETIAWRAEECAQASMAAAETRRLKKENCSGCFFFRNGCNGSTYDVKCHVTEAELVAGTTEQICAEYGSEENFEGALKLCGSISRNYVPLMRTEAHIGYPLLNGAFQLVKGHAPFTRPLEVTKSVAEESTGGWGSLSQKTLHLAFWVVKEIQQMDAGLGRGHSPDFVRISGHRNRVVGVKLQGEHLVVKSGSAGGVFETKWGELGKSCDKLSLQQPQVIGRILNRGV